MAETNFDETVQIFNDTASALNQAIINFSKDSKSRKTTDYYNKKIPYFETLLNDCKHCMSLLMDIDPNNEFFGSSFEQIYLTPKQLIDKAEEHLKNLNDLHNHVNKNIIDQTFQDNQRDSGSEFEPSTIAESLQREIDKLKQKLLQVPILLSSIDELKLENSKLRVTNNKLKIEVNRLISEADTPNISSSLVNAPKSHIHGILKLVPKFRGKPEELKVYINKIEELLPYVTTGPDKALFITTIKNHFLDEAANILIDESDLHTWNDIKEILTKNFQPSPNHSNSMALLNRMQQNSNESVTDFCKRIKVILNKLKNSIPEGTTKQFWYSHTEKYAIQCLQDGLSDLKIQARLSAIDHDTFFLAAQCAVDMDERINHNTLKINEKKPIKVCSYCKKNNHTVDSCKLLEEKNNTPSTSKIVDENPFKCTICNKNSHTTKICYKNPDNKKLTDSQKPIEMPKQTVNSIEMNVDDDNNDWLSEN